MQRFTKTRSVIEKVVTLIVNSLRYCSRSMIVVPVAALVFSQSTFAQSAAREENNNAAVLQIITSMLLMAGREGPIQVSLDKVTSGRFALQAGSGDEENGLTVEFEGNADDLVLCFGTQGIASGEVAIELNGNNIGNLTTGENCLTFSPGNGVGQQHSGTNTLQFIDSVPEQGRFVSDFSLRFPRVLGLTRISRTAWDQSAVRKVLKIFAFGGHATDNQINIWANMDPDTAVAQMLNFSEHNLRLSPLATGERYTATSSQHGTLTDFSEYLGSNASALPLPLNVEGVDYPRQRFALSGYDRQGVFMRMATTRGLNPFRQRIGLWETNYHLAVNLDTQVEHRQLATYYDEIMEAHESGVPYQDVIAVASRSAAVAMQYGHRRNRWIEINGEYLCLCNDDFAREIHQLFFGILGTEDPLSTAEYNHHEEVTIPQTARMLTDMKVDYDDGLSRHPDYVTFGTSEHHTGALDILNQSISGATAAEKIDNLVDISIEHPESLKQLPLMIIGGLADDALTPAKEAQLQAAWAEMGDNKNFLTFIHAYAISDLFHSPEQRKYLNSFERNIYLANKSYLTNMESLLDRVYFGSQFRDENVEIFRPSHNVFGGQTALEAANSATVFENNFNSFTENEWNFRVRGTSCQAGDMYDFCDFGSTWIKDWGRVIPQTNGNYIVSEVASWLWNHAVGNMDNYGTLEQAHLTAILGAANRSNDPNDHQQRFFSLNHILCIRQEILDNAPAGQQDVSLDRLMRYSGYGYYCSPDESAGSERYSASEIALLNRVYSKSEIENTDYIQALLDEIGQEEISLGSSSSDTVRIRANRRVQSALSFIFATPFIFVEEQQQ